MEIQKELSDVRENKKTFRDVIAEIKSKQEELNKKIHLFKVLDAIDVLEEMVRGKVFHKYGIDEIKFVHIQDYDIGNKLNFELYNCENGERQEVLKYNSSGDYSFPFSIIKSLVKNFDGFDEDNISEDFNNLKNVHELYFEAKKGIGERFKNLLLSKEIKTVLGFNELNNNLVSNSENVSKKPKI